MDTTRISIEGMSCGGCVKSVSGALGALPGVARVEVSLENGEAVVEYDAVAVSREQLLAAIEDAGFDAH